jgi:hypothetical protein
MDSSYRNGANNKLLTTDKRVNAYNKPSVVYSKRAIKNMNSLSEPHLVLPLLKVIEPPEK